MASPCFRGGPLSTLPSPAASSASFCVCGPSSRALVLHNVSWHGKRENEQCGIVPSFVRLATFVMLKVGLGIEPLCTWHAVPLTQTRQLFGHLCFLVELQVSLGLNIGMDLVEVACVPPRLLLRLCTSYGGHCDRWNGGVRTGDGRFNTGLIGL
jgi:hypothetical protein